MQHGDGRHAHHIEVFKRKFVVSLILTIPILLLSEMIQEWFRISIEIPFQREVLLILSSIVYFYGGYPFLKGSFGEIKNRQPGMMTLISTAVSVAFFYSAGAIFMGGKDFFWELATLLDVMLLGHWIEMRSIMGASRALEEARHLARHGNNRKILVRAKAALARASSATSRWPVINAMW